MAAKKTKQVEDGTTRYLVLVGPIDYKDRRVVEGDVIDDYPPTELEHALEHGLLEVTDKQLSTGVEATPPTQRPWADDDDEDDE